MQDPQVHFVKQTIQSWPFVEADLIQHIMDNSLCNQLLPASCFYPQKVGKFGEIGVKLLNWETSQADKTIIKIHPKRFVIHFST